MTDLRFPVPDADRAAERLRRLPVAGRPATFKRNWSCLSCRRAIGSTGRLLTLGAPTCMARPCEQTRLGAFSRSLPTAYGAAVTQGSAALLTSVLALPDGRFSIGLDAIVQKADDLARAWADLVFWQISFDAWERETDPVGYAEGRIHVLPPRRLDDVVALRARGAFVPLDPLLGLAPDIRDGILSWRSRVARGERP